MASVDEIFRSSRSGIAPKRKLEDPTSNSSYRSQPSKSAKLANGSSPHSFPSRAQASVAQAATVEDERTTDDDDIEAGPSLPPEEGVEDEAGEDEEGRFFGGGVTKQERQALDFLEQTAGADEDVHEEEVYDLAWLRRSAVSLHKKIEKNSAMRTRYADQPQKFIQSEADLDDELKGLSILSEHTDLYNDFSTIAEGGVESLVNLLSHENTDIAIRAVQVLAELTDDDIEADEQQWHSLVRTALKAGMIELLVSNLSRLDEKTSETDREGVYHILELFENLISNSSNLSSIISDPNLLPWLLSRINTPDPEIPTKVSQNRQYAAEILAILLQSSPGLRKTFATDRKQNGIDTLLQLLSTYRKRDPERDSDEEEFAENLFDCLTVLVDDADGATAFLDSEGVELCLIMLREGKMSKSRALTVLDHGVGGKGGTAVCDRFVEAAGLKTVFGMFMNTKQKEQPAHKGGGEKETLEHLIGIFANLLRHTPAESPARIRTLAKFVEKDYEKIVRLVEVRKEYAARLARVERDIEEEKQVVDPDDHADMEAEWFSRRLDAGLFAGQTLDVILAWLVAEDAGAAKRIEELLGTVSILSKSLREQERGIDEDTQADGAELREMLDVLIRCLKGDSAGGSLIGAL